MHNNGSDISAAARAKCRVFSRRYNTFGVWACQVETERGRAIKKKKKKWPEDCL